MPIILINDEEFKIIYPNGINEDGSLNNITFTVSSIDSINNKNILDDPEVKNILDNIVKVKNMIQDICDNYDI